MHVAILQRYLAGWRGGVRVSIQLARSLLAVGHSVTLVGYRGQHPDAGYYPLPTAASVVLLRRPCKAGVLAEAAWLRDAVNALSPTDLLVAATWMDAAAAATTGRTWLYLVQAMETDSLAQEADGDERALCESTYRHSVSHVTVSEHMRGELKARYGIETAVVIAPSVAAPFLEAGHKSPKRRPSADGTRVLFAGPATEAKGFNDLRFALSILADRGTRFTLTVATQGRPPRDIRALPFRLTWREPVDDHEMLDIYQESDLVVVPSRNEAFGLVPLEAMATGIPTVVADSGGVRAYAEDEVNTLVVPPATPEALAAAIQRLVTGAGLARQLVARGKMTAHRFTSETMTTAWAHLLAREFR